MTIQFKMLTISITATIALLSSQMVLAASDVVVLKNDKIGVAASAAALDFRNATPLKKIALPGQARKIDPPDDISLISENPSPPTIKVDPSTSRLYDIAPALSDDNAPFPVDMGTSGALYSILGMIPNTQANSKNYPYRTTGKLFFNVGSGTAYCTASVISKRVIVTAGHCVSDGNGNFYTNFIFVPATFNGSAPYEMWNWGLVTTTTTWHNGGGGVPNAADYAMIVLQDRDVPAGGTIRRIGDVTGTLGWATGSCGSNHLHMLGYPGNVFNGQKPAISMAQTWRNILPLNCEYGNPQTFGASGGPWVQNFGPIAGVKPQQVPATDRVVAVASYTYGETYGVLGASNFDSRFVSLWNVACTGTGNCN